MTRVRIGFPVIFPATGDVAAVWISTRPTASGKVYWNNIPLHAYQPFGDGRISRAALEIARQREIHFACKSGTDALDDVTPGATVALEGDSFGLAFELARHADLSNLDDAEVSLLLSGRIDQENGYPLPLLNDSLLPKAAFAINKGWPLLLHPNDYKRAAAEFTDNAANDFPLNADFAVLVGGKLFRIPISKGDRWRQSARAWWHTLGQSMGLPLLHSSGEVDVGAGTRHPRIFTGTALADLFAAALPTAEPFRSTLLAANPTYFNGELFDIGLEAIEHKSDIFGEVPGNTVSRNILISGPTGCGKTALTEALIVNTVQELDQKVIYISPTRSLANERYREMLRRFAFESTDLDPAAGIPKSQIVLSTGEETATDWRITSGDFKIAVMVNEKANLFLRPPRRVLERLGLVVFDELHMLADPVRGGVLDMMIAKLKRENESRRERGRSPLRIVGITTENALLQRLTGAFSVMDRAANAVPPVVITAARRPIPATHIAAVYGSEGASPDATILTTIHIDEDRYLPAPTLRSLISTLRSQIAASRDDTLRHEGFVSPIDLVKTNTALQTPYRTVLIAHPSIAQLRDLAAQLANSRARYAFEIHPEFSRLLDLGAAPASMIPSLRKFASKGIYLHHSEMRRELREWTEEFFRDIRTREAEDLPPYVLFATETLFYGVNLCVDCVLLTRHAWARDRGSSAGVERAALTPTQYHNLLGRAGRKGASGAREIQATAIVGISEQALKEVSDNVADFVLRYYSAARLNPDASDDVSALIAQQDLTDPPLTLERAGYSSFRSVLDALRHHNEGMRDRQYAFSSDVVSLIAKTVFAHTTSRPPDAWARVVTTILDLASSPQYGLVSKNEADGRFLITAKAEALIDTGTPWESVAPMQRWLSLIKDLAPDQELPADILVPGFVCTSGIWIPARTLCWEFRQTAVIDAEAERNDAEVELLLRKQLSLSLFRDDDLADRTVAKLAELVDSLRASLPVNVERYRRAIFFRLVTAFLRWLDGSDEDDIAELSLHNPIESQDRLRERIGSEARHWREMYGDKASWLAMMCRRFFEKSGDLRREHLRELPRLSQRLRLGVPALGVPFCSDTRLPGLRRQVRHLLNRHITPGEVLRDRNPTATLSALARESSDLVGFTPDSFVDGVYRFYLNQTDTLKSSLLAALPPKASEPWTAGREILDELLLRRREPGGALALPKTADVARFRQVLVDIVALSGNIQALPQTDGASLRLRPQNDSTGSQDFVFSVIGFGDGAIRQGDVDVFLPWPDALRERTAVSAVGAMVLTYLLARGFVELPRIRRWSAGTKGLSSIREFLDELAVDMPDLPSELRESLLQFNEPGVD